MLAERPGYESHRSVAKRFGAKLRTFVRARERSFGAIAEAVQSQLTAETRLVVVSHLHNPTGAAFDSADIEALEKLAERHGFWILCDETLRDADPEQPLGTLARRGSRWVTISSLTKSYGLGGLRIGWIAGGADALGRCADALNALSVLPASPSLALALALVPHLDDLRSRTRRILQTNHAAWARVPVPRGHEQEGAGRDRSRHRARAPRYDRVVPVRRRHARRRVLGHVRVQVRSRRRARRFLRRLARHPHRRRHRAEEVRGGARAARPRARGVHPRAHGGMSDDSALARIQADMTAAMKSRNADTLSTLRMLKTAIMEAKTKKAKDATLSADEEIDVLQRYVKKRRETLDEMKKLGRDDLAAREQQEIEVTLRYLPQMLGDSELRAIVTEVVAATGASAKDMGKVIGAVMARVKGRAEGGAVSRLVKEALSS